MLLDILAKVEISVRDYQKKCCELSFLNMHTHSYPPSYLFDLIHPNSFVQVNLLWGCSCPLTDPSIYPRRFPQFLWKSSIRKV